MKRREEEHALLAEGINSMEAGMLKSLLAAEGIPCLTQGPDFDVAELGTAAHGMLRGTNLYVPHAAFEKAKAILAAAEWTPQGESEPAAE